MNCFRNSSDSRKASAWLEDDVAANGARYTGNEFNNRLMRQAHQVIVDAAPENLGCNLQLAGKAPIEPVNQNVCVNENGHARRWSSLLQPLSRGCFAGRANGRLRWRSVAWSNKRSCDSRFSGITCLAGGMTRITSPAATQSMSSPGRILYRSAIFFGRVTWYLDVTLAMRISRTPVYPYHSKDQILVQQPVWPLFRSSRASPKTLHSRQSRHSAL